MFSTSQEAEAAFYAAFGNADVEAMMRVWAQSAEIACIHPAGPRLQGVDAIRSSWEQILVDRVLRSFSLRGRRVSGEGDFRIHMIEEIISVPGTAFVAPPVLATNVYQRSEAGWAMILHHASAAPATLLETRGNTDKRPPRLH